MEDATRPVEAIYVREFRTRPVYMVPGRGVVLALRAAEERREGFLGKLVTDDIKCGRIPWEERNEVSE